MNEDKNHNNEKENALGINIVKAGMLTKILTKQTFDEAKTKVTPEQFIVIMALKENGSMYQREIGAIVLKDRPNINRIVTILENKGYVTRTSEIQGRKVTQVALTYDGEKIYDEIMPVITSVWEKIHSEVTDEELEIFIKILKKVQKTIKNNVKIQL